MCNTFLENELPTEFIIHHFDSLIPVQLKTDNVAKLIRWYLYECLSGQQDNRTMKTSTWS